MQVAVAYDETAVLIDVPDDATVVAPTDPKPLADSERTVREAVRPWLRGMRPPGVLVLPDVPAFPQSAVLPGLLSELARVGLRRESLTLVHGPRLALDDQLVERYTVQVHDPADLDAHEHVGEVDGVPVLLHRAYADATTRIAVGVVQPHHVYGFTGGAETICPGISAEPTVTAVHARGSDPTATFLVTRGNAVHDFIRAAVKQAPPRLSVDVTTNSPGELTGVWCGPLPHEHQAACAVVSQFVRRTVPSHADVVVAGGDSVAGAVAAAERVVRRGGTIVALADIARTETRTEMQSGLARVLVVQPAQLAYALQSLLPADLCVLTRAASTVVSVGA